jgi:multidrug efflux pump subunit AcrA (membrane-fusion protein)
MPQAYAPFIRTGSKAAVTLREFPNQRFLGLVARTAEFIDPVTRTMVVEVDLPNQDGKLLPGSYGEVHFKAGGGLERVTLPVNTMLFRSKGLQVAVVGPGGKVSLRSVSVGRDFGTTLEVLSGAGLGDQVVVNPPDSLEDGQKVFVDGRP